ncbi:MAG: hypothetical protein PHP03_00280 [Candidatus Pacebacteria bacterium]|nr:hypothetical protein [Candidatus Paceibacterota bacterium]
MDDGSSVGVRGAPKGKYNPSGQKVAYKGSALNVVWEIFQTMDRPLFEEDVAHFADIFSEKKFSASRIKEKISFLEGSGCFERIGEKYILKREFLNKGIPFVKKEEIEKLMQGEPAKQEEKQKGGFVSALQ